MLTKNTDIQIRAWRLSCLAAALLVTAVSCSRPAAPSLFKKIPAGQENVGFLSSYANLKPNPNFENTRSYISTDPVKNIHQYVAIIVEHPVVYVSTNADEKAVPDRGVTALTEYFQNAVEEAVEDAFPIVQSPGPLVLRLRTAIVGVDVGNETPAAQKDGKGLDRALNIGKVGVEMELVDSETGQQIAAAVDRETLGEGAEVGSPTFTREEKFRAATEAFDGWAKRLRLFLDLSAELSADDVKRVEESNFPYAVLGGPIKAK